MIGKLWPLLLAVCLGGCAGLGTGFDDHSHFDRAAAPFFFSHDLRPTDGERYLEDERDVYRPMTDLNLAEERDTRDNARAGLAPAEPSVAAGCSLADRFDRDGVLAYNFDDHQSRVSLNMDMGNVGFSGVEVDKVMVKYSFKLQKSARPKEGCRYPSGFQGLIGSGYNELILRQRNTVWQQLRDENPLGLFD